MVAQRPLRPGPGPEDATQTSGHDEQQVKHLTKSISDLKDEVDKWQTVMTAAGIATGVSV